METEEEFEGMSFTLLTKKGHKQQVHTYIHSLMRRVVCFFQICVVCCVTFVGHSFAFCCVVVFLFCFLLCFVFLVFCCVCFNMSLKSRLLLFLAVCRQRRL